ncbi:MAG: DNA repair protein RecO [Hylemonella sp.]|uniref:DNA repair protein RecO n=1 Tax=Hylemonella sp. TaxID=2066020 RepID=UPI0022BC5CF9|nr:DNA repair protein RecO [Hylemonella sp.]MCZ8251043.1 DNA repair protein RecO [Hylemonella sp.]
MATKRISEEPAYVLHRYDWSETSLILEVFTRHHGRIALVAKGAKRPTSSFRPILLPLQPLRLSYGGESEVRTLKSAEWVGGHVMPTGEALLSGYYLNELLLQLLARDDAHPALFDVYAQVVQVLASEHTEVLEAALRSFELLLLREIGLLPQLDRQTLTLAPLDEATVYALVPEGGLRTRGPGDRAGLSGAQWRALQQALETGAPFTDTLRACAAVMGELKPLLRTLLHYHCGVSTLRTRQMMVDLQSL